MNDKKHLPLMGVGPIYVISIVLITIIGVILSEVGVINKVKINILQIPFYIIGIALITIGILFWIQANFVSKIDENIKNNKLIKSGVYSYVRNPIYSAFFMVCSGILFVENNIWLLVLPVVYWAFMTILMKCTEEVWLLDLYGQEYKEYCKKVNRCIPCFIKR